MRRVAILPLVAAALAGASFRPDAALSATEDIGSWRLLCRTDRMTDRASCTLLHREPAERSQPGRPALALEVVERGGRLLPAVTLRELSLDGAARGLLAMAGVAQLRFPPNRHFELPCALEGRALVCAPRDADAPRAAEELTRAERVLVRVTGLGGDANADPAELRLSSTAEALARYRAASPAGSAAPEGGGLELRDLLGRALRGLGG